MDLLKAGHSVLISSHELILAGGALGVLSILAGLVSRRIGAPILLVFLAIGMLIGEDGVLGIRFDNFAAAYVIGSIALAVILFEGGLKTPIAMLRLAFWPAALLATVGVAITAGMLGGFITMAVGVPIAGALLAGSMAAPTDAAAVNTLLRSAGVSLPPRLAALLEVESGLNDPMSIFLTILLLRVIAAPGMMSVGSAVVLFIEEMAGGAVLGIIGGWVLSLALRRLRLEPALATVLAFTGALTLFGFAQLLGTSGFLAIYIAGLITGATQHRAHTDVEHFCEGMAWLAQIVLFLMLGLLVTPHKLIPFIPTGVVAAIVLMVVARPVAVMACLLPSGFSLRDSTFASWVGLRGAVPIYLSLLPALVDPNRDAALFANIFVLVIASLLIQGWTIAPVARLLGYRRAAPDRTAG